MAAPELQDRHVTARLSETASELSDAARRLGEVREHVDFDIDIQPMVQKAQLGLWQALRALIGGLIVLPRVLVRGLALLSSAIDDLLSRSADLLSRGAQLGADLGERTREVAAAVPPSRRGRRQARLRAAGFVSAGFGAGFIVGWIMGRRREAVEVFDEPPAIDTVATPATSEPSLAGESSPAGEPSTATADHTAAMPRRNGATGGSGGPGSTGASDTPGTPGPLT